MKGGWTSGWMSRQMTGGWVDVSVSRYDGKEEGKVV